MPPSTPDNPPREGGSTGDTAEAIEAIGRGFARLERHLLDAPQEINDDGTVTPPRLGMISTVKRHMEEDAVVQQEIRDRVTALEDGHKQILEAIKSHGRIKIPGTHWRLPVGVIYALVALAGLIVLRMTSADLRILGERVVDNTLHPAPTAPAPVERPAPVRDGGP